MFEEVGRLASRWSQTYLRWQPPCLTPRLPSHTPFVYLLHYCVPSPPRGHLSKRQRFALLSCHPQRCCVVCYIGMSGKVKGCDNVAEDQRHQLCILCSQLCGFGSHHASFLPSVSHLIVAAVLRAGAAKERLSHFSLRCQSPWLLCKSKNARLPTGGDKIDMEE